VFAIVEDIVVTASGKIMVKAEPDNDGLLKQLLKLCAQKCKVMLQRKLLTLFHWSSKNCSWTWQFQSDATFKMHPPWRCSSCQTLVKHGAIPIFFPIRLVI